MGKDPFYRSPEHVANHPPRTSVGRRRGIRSPAALALLVPALIVGGVSCAMGGGAENPMSAAGSQDGSFTVGSNVITGEAARAVTAGNLYEVVQRLHPLWLRERSGRSYRVATEIMVIQGGMYFGDVESLRELNNENVWTISYMDGAAATAAFPYPGVQPHILGIYS